MLVGHNPAFTQILNFFCEESNIANLPTTGLAEMKFDSNNWSDIKKAKLNLLLFPKNLR
jgi:phosphohistidine phosphatase